LIFKSKALRDYAGDFGLKKIVFGCKVSSESGLSAPRETVNADRLEDNGGKMWVAE
jgi:hypothetical protein